MKRKPRDREPKPSHVAFHPDGLSVAAYNDGDAEILARRHGCDLRHLRQMAIQKKKPGKCIVVSKFMRGEDCQVLITYWYGFIGAGSRGINDNGPLIMVATPTEDYSGADWRSDARALLQRGYVAMTGFVEGGNVA